MTAFDVVIVTADYRVTQEVSDLGWVDLDLGSSPGWWTTNIVTYWPKE